MPQSHRRYGLLLEVLRMMGHNPQERWEGAKMHDDWMRKSLGITRLAVFGDFGLC